MSKFIETDFVRFLYSDGSEASSEKKINIQRSKRSSTESMSKTYIQIYGFEMGK